VQGLDRGDTKCFRTSSSWTPTREGYPNYWCCRCSCRDGHDHCCDNVIRDGRWPIRRAPTNESTACVRFWRWRPQVTESKDRDPNCWEQGLRRFRSARCHSVGRRNENPPGGCRRRANHPPLIRDLAPTSEHWKWREHARTTPREFLLPHPTSFVTWWSPTNESGLVSPCVPQLLHGTGTHAFLESLCEARVPRSWIRHGPLGPPRRNALRTVTTASNGRCSTGIDRRSTSIALWVLRRWTSGQSFASLAMPSLHSLGRSTRMMTRRE